MKHARAALIAALAFGPVATAAAEHADDLRPPQRQAQAVERHDVLHIMAGDTLPKDGVRHLPSWQATVLPRIADNRPTGRADWDIDYPSQLAPAPQR